MSAVRTRVDPITAAVIGGALDSIAVEMGHKLARMAYSSIIRESEDFGCVICDDAGAPAVRVVAVDAAPVRPDPRLHRRHQPALRRARRSTGRPGDVVIHNHSYYGASHQPDVGFVVPVFVGDELVGFSATTAHHLDLGALTPGSCGIVDATDAFAEGLQFNAIKVEEGGRRNEAIWQILRDNCRAPHLVVGDMEAQVAAVQDRGRALPRADRAVTASTRSGRRRDDLMDYSERMLRREIEKLPDGVYRAEGHLDGFVGHPDERYRDLRDQGRGHRRRLRA